MQWLQSPVFWLAFVIVGFHALLFFASLLERRWTFPYIPLLPAVRKIQSDPISQTGDGQPMSTQPIEGNAAMDVVALPHYVLLMSDDAFLAGFAFDGVIVHAKPAIKITATTWMSVDRSTIIMSGAGTSFNMPSFQTWIFTPLTDGRYLVTTDNNDEGDRSGLYIKTRVIRQRFDKLLLAHHQSVNRYEAQVSTFQEPSVLDAYHNILSCRVDRMVQKKLARYRDRDKQYWSYSIWGSIRNCLGFFVQLAQTLPQARRVGMPPIATHEPVMLGQSVYERYSEASRKA